MQKADNKLGVADVAKALDSVNRGRATIHSMMFEPKERILHLAYAGEKGATKKPLTKLDLRTLFEKK